MRLVEDLPETGGRPERPDADDARGVARTVLPELVAAELVDDVKVDPPVAVDVGRGEAVSVVVVNRFIELARIVGGPLDERDAAFRQAILKTEIVEDPDLSGGFLLSRLPDWNGLDTRIARRDADLRKRVAAARRTRARNAGGPDRRATPEELIADRF